ncbi:MAG: DNA repair protein RadC [Flavobacteriaceae bacterium]|nr:DNA repair protein RadC [Flavobacteriaceae bacterium]
MTNRSFPIHRWSEEDRPREKLLKKGKSSLSDSELLAILIGTGSKEESAVNLCKRILSSVNYNLNEISKLSVNELIRFKGIGRAKAISIIAAIELGKRRKSEQATHIKINSSEAVFKLLNPVFEDLHHEEFWVVYLNNANRVIEKSQLSKGGITGTIVDVRLVLKKALQLGSVNIIISHNHPSGSLKPSVTDIELTRKISIACNSVDIKLLDHVIISKEGYYSFADEQQI